VSYRSHSDETVVESRRLSGLGLSDYEVARRLGVPRSNVMNWRKRATPRRRGGRTRPDHYVPADPEQYAYLLGCYLGDGHLWHSSANSWRLGIYCDSAYPAILDEIETAIRACAPETPVRRNRRPNSAGIVLFASSNVWDLAFPQHGPGRKHDRPIRLESWQAEITRANPQQLLRGLIHSDGCRVENRFKTKLPSGRTAEYAYPRYFFSNLSDDIREIFCAHCELIGVRWTQSNARNISISHRDSVALLDMFIGPKS